MRSLQDIHASIEAIEQELIDLVATATEAATDAAVTEATFKTQFAKARLLARANATGKITVDEVTDRATVECSESRLGYLVANGRLTTVREALRAAQSRLDGLRTEAASYRGAGG